MQRQNATPMFFKCPTFRCNKMRPSTLVLVATWARPPTHNTCLPNDRRVPTVLWIWTCQTVPSAMKLDYYVWVAKALPSLLWPTRTSVVSCQGVQVRDRRDTQLVVLSESESSFSLNNITCTLCIQYTYWFHARVYVCVCSPKMQRTVR